MEFSLQYIIIFIFVILFLIGLFSSKSRSTSRNAKKSRLYLSTENKINIVNKNDHLDVVILSKYKRKALMNKSEYQLFLRLEKLLSKGYQEFRLFTQVSMGEFLESIDKEAHFAINSKRVDFLIVDKNGYAVIVIEYQGQGHYQDNAAKRDAVKREACRKAGVIFLEFQPNYGKAELEFVVENLKRYLIKN